MSARRIGRARSTRGGALIIVLLVVLVLTIIGIGVAYFTQLEDQTSGNIRLAKTAFYAAESGLRTGEQALTQANTAGVPGTELVTYRVGMPSRIDLPGGGQGIPLDIRGTPYDRIMLRAAFGTSDVTTYTLYVRNNIEDPGNRVAPIVDSDNTINLISVGQVWANAGTVAVPVTGRLLATKILEEQIQLGSPGESVAPQEGVNESGTNTGQIGR